MIDRPSSYSQFRYFFAKFVIFPVGYSNYFLTGCAARGLKLLSIFSPQKTTDLKLFFEIFTNQAPLLRVFLPQNGWFYHVFAVFAKWDPLLRIFWTKMGPMSKDFCWKSNPFGRHIPVCLNMWVPPRVIFLFCLAQRINGMREYILREWTWMIVYTM